MNFQPRPGLLVRSSSTLVALALASGELGADGGWLRGRAPLGGAGQRVALATGVLTWKVLEGEVMVGDDALNGDHCRNRFIGGSPIYIYIYVYSDVRPMQGLRKYPHLNHMKRQLKCGPTEITTCLPIGFTLGILQTNGETIDR